MLDRNLLPKDGTVFYQPQYFGAARSEKIFTELLGVTQWRQESIKIFGRSMPQPRLVSWVGDPEAEYTYSHLMLRPEPWTPLLLTIKQEIEEDLGQSFNSVLLNLYRNQKDSNGWHSDDEKELGKNPCIASLSFGESRDFLLKHKKSEELKLKLKLESGSLLVMSGKTQEFWKHTLPKRAGELGPRINLTFRQIIK